MISLLKSKFNFNSDIISNNIFRKKLNKFIKNMDVQLIVNVLNSDMDCYKGFEYNVLIDNGELNKLFNSNEYNNQYYTRILISQLDDELNEINVSIISVGSYIVLKKERVDYISDDKTCVYLFYMDKNKKVHIYKDKQKEKNKSSLVKLRLLKKEIACL